MLKYVLIVVMLMSTSIFSGEEIIVVPSPKDIPILPKEHIKDSDLIGPYKKKVKNIQYSSKAILA